MLKNLIRIYYNQDEAGTGKAPKDEEKDENVKDLLMKVKEENDKAINALKEDFNKKISERDNIIAQLMAGKNLAPKDDTPAFIKAINDKRLKERREF